MILTWSEVCLAIYNSFVLMRTLLIYLLYLLFITVSVRFLFLNPSRSRSLSSFPFFIFHQFRCFLVRWQIMWHNNNNNILFLYERKREREGARQWKRIKSKRINVNEHQIRHNLRCTLHTNTSIDWKRKRITKKFAREEKRMNRWTNEHTCQFK